MTLFLLQNGTRNLSGKGTQCKDGLTYSCCVNVILKDWFGLEGSKRSDLKPECVVCRPSHNQPDWKKKKMTLMERYLNSKRYHLSLLFCMSACSRKYTLSFAPAFPPLSLSVLASMMRLENYTSASEMKEADQNMASDIIKLHRWSKYWTFASRNQKITSIICWLKRSKS